MNTKFSRTQIILACSLFTSIALLTFTLENNTDSSLSYRKIIQEDSASVFLVHNMALNLQNKYNDVLKTDKKIRILIIPGHEPNDGGAVYTNLKERDMTLSLGLDLAEYLKNDPHYEVVLTRDIHGWNPVFENYFTSNKEGIANFVSIKKAAMDQSIAAGEVLKVDSGIEHIDALPDVAMRLFAINKWANENNIDLMIHIHFNEYPRSHPKKPGKYTGFIIYVPDPQYSNAKTTSEIANNILPRLSSVFRVSNLPTESAGIVPEQRLIALGSDNTADMPSILIEYGYIYDTLFATKAKRVSTLDTMAKETYLGIEDFFIGTTTINQAPN
jgi:N-acetylmuramoyl-L-alanine amidase